MDIELAKRNGKINLSLAGIKNLKSELSVKITMLQQSLLADLVTDVPAPVRLQNLVKTLRQHFHCGAVVLLKRDGTRSAPLPCMA